MNKQKWWILIAAIALIGGTGLLLGRLREHQKLGTPGVKAVPTPGSLIMQIDLPERVLGFTSSNMPTAKVVLDFLPKDTSYAQRVYTAPDGFQVQANIVLMGMDRGSIHRADICLPAQGWRILSKTMIDIPISGKVPYHLPAAKWLLSNIVQTQEGRKVELRAIYLFWFVADDQRTASHLQRMWWLARDLIFRGVLQRWAYVGYFCTFQPGEEDAASARLTKFVSASVPEFQLPPGSDEETSVVKW